MNLILDLYKNAWASLSRSPRELLRFVWVPAILLVAVESLLEFSNLGGGPGSMRIAYYAAIPSGGVYILLTISLCRYLLLRGDTRDRRPLPTASQFADYSLWFLGIGLIGSMILVPGAIIGILVAGLDGGAAFYVPLLIAAVPACYLVAKASLILPDRAIGARASLGDAMAWSDGHGWALAVAAVVIPFAAWETAGLALALTSGAVGATLSVLVPILLVTFETAVLAAAYHRFVPRPRSESVHPLLAAAE